MLVFTLVLPLLPVGGRPPGLPVRAVRRMARRLAGLRQAYEKRGPAGRVRRGLTGLHIDFAPERLHDLVDRGQPQARAVPLGGEIGVEDVAEVPGRDALPGIRDRKDAKTPNFTFLGVKLGVYFTIC